MREKRQSLMAYMRENMPQTAAFLAEYSAAFGAETVKDSVRAGLDGLPTFHAEENGLELGTREAEAVSYVTAAEMVIRPNQPPAMDMVRKGKK